MIGEAKESSTLPVQVQRRLEGLRTGPGAQNRQLTRVERRVLDALLAPQLRGKPVEAKAEAAGISRSRFYQVMRDPWFDEQRRNLLRTQLQEQAVEFVQAAAETAKIVGRDGHNDRKLVLSMTGDYVERQQHEHSGNVGPMVAIVGVDPSQI